MCVEFPFKASTHSGMIHCILSDFKHWTTLAPCMSGCGRSSDREYCHSGTGRQLSLTLQNVGVFQHLVEAAEQSDFMLLDISVSLTL